MVDITVDVGDIVLVLWRDAYFDFKLEDTSGIKEDYMASTVGWVLAIGPKFLSIAQERLPEDDGWRGVTHLPLEGVLAIEVLA